MSDVRGYTLPQIGRFLDCINDAERAERRAALITARAAQAKNDQFKNIIKELG